MHQPQSHHHHNHHHHNPQQNHQQQQQQPQQQLVPPLPRPPQSQQQPNQMPISPTMPQQQQQQLQPHQQQQQWVGPHPPMHVTASQTTPHHHHHHHPPPHTQQSAQHHHHHHPQQHQQQAQHQHQHQHPHHHHPHPLPQTHSQHPAQHHHHHHPQQPNQHQHQHQHQHPHQQHHHPTQPQPPQQQQAPSQPPQQQQPPTHHMTHPAGPQMLINQQYPGANFIYTQVGSHAFVSPSSHLQQPYDHSSSASHLPHSVGVSSQQQPVSISNHHPGNMPINQVPPPAVISSTNTGTTNVHQINNRPVMEPHMSNRMPLNQQPHMIPNPYMQPPFNLMVSYPHLNPNLYPYGPPGGHLPSSPAMMPPIRVPADMNIRQPFNPQNPATPIPPPATLSQPSPAPVKPAVSTVTLPPPAPLISTPAVVVPPIKPRPKKALAIVDPLTKHVYTEDELKRSPSSQQSGSSKDSGVSKSSPKESSSSDRDSTLNDDIIKKSPTESLTSERVLVSSEDSTPIVEVILEPAEVKAYSEPPIQTHSILQSSVDSNSQLEPQIPLSERHQQSQPQTQSPEPDHESSSSPEGKALPNGETGVACSEENLVGDLSKSVAEISISVKDEKQSDDSSVCEDTPIKKKTNPNLPYADNQYSPMNHSGSKKYSIKFLKAVYKEMGLEKQDNTPRIGSLDFSPHYVTSHGGGMNFGRDYSLPQPMARRASQQGVKPRKIITTHSLQQEVELKTAEKPWKPELEQEKSKLEGEMDTNRLLKVFRGHLNKLTPQKYDSLIEKINELDLKGSDRLNRVIDLVFDKAVDEPNFCELYARMCKVIAAKDNDFCFHLVRKCQEEFETSDLYCDLNVDQRQAEIDVETDAQKKKLMSEELYEDMRLRRVKYLGTIKLIGEMYKLGLLIPKIIGFCMSRLIDDPTNENIECLCSLIETVGATMANESQAEIKLALARTIKNLAALADPKKTSDLLALESRIKFRIQDTVDLSKRNWRPRMVDNNPKKIEEIREEVKDEQMRQFQNHSNQLSKNLLKPDDRDRNRRPGGVHQYSSRGSGKW